LDYIVNHVRNIHSHPAIPGGYTGARCPNWEGGFLSGVKVF
jgi:hypothetical protein